MDETERDLLAQVQAATDARLEARGIAHGMDFDEVSMTYVEELTAAAVSRERRVHELEQRLRDLGDKDIDRSLVPSPVDTVVTPEGMGDLFECWDRYENARTPVDAAFMLARFYDAWMEFRRALVVAGVLPEEKN